MVLTLCAFNSDVLLGSKCQEIKFLEKMVIEGMKTRDLSMGHEFDVIQRALKK